MSGERELPTSWTWATLDELTVSMGGGTPDTRDARFWEDGTIPWVSPKDMKSFEIRSAIDKVSVAALARLSLVPLNSVLVVVRSGILSRTLPVALNGVAVTINQDMRAFVPVKEIEPRFLAWQLVAYEREILDGCAKDGTTVASIEGVRLSNFPLTVAPHSEQLRVIGLLEELTSELDAAVAELELARRKLTQYRQSLLKAAVEGDLTAEWRAGNPPQETGAELLTRILRERRARWEARQLERFRRQARKAPSDWQTAYPEGAATADHSAMPGLPEGWTWATVEQLSPDDLANGRSVPTAEQGAKVLRLTAVRRGCIDLDEYKHGAWTAEEAAPFYVQQDDLLIVRGNGSLSLVGRAGLVPPVVEPVAYPDTLIRLRTLGAIVRPAWLAALWDSERTRNHFERRARTSAGIYKISQPDIVSVMVAVPPLAEQDEALVRLANAMEQLEATQSAIEQGLKMAAAQRQNILRAAFSGQLVPQDPNDEPASVLLERIRTERAAACAASSRPLPRRRAGQSVAT